MVRKFLEVTPGQVSDTDIVPGAREVPGGNYTDPSGEIGRAVGKT